MSDRHIENKSNTRRRFIRGTALAAGGAALLGADLGANAQSPQAVQPPLAGGPPSSSVRLRRRPRTCRNWDRSAS
jgi:hypothetical protein